MFYMLIKNQMYYFQLNIWKKTRFSVVIAIPQNQQAVVFVDKGYGQNLILAHA